MTPSWAEPLPDGQWLVRVKAVPGASRTRVVGPLGDMLKIQVAAPPEAGAANAAICRLLSEYFQCPSSDITLRTGKSSPRKIFLIARIPLGFPSD